ncbi:MAG: hypothetical protein OXQ30_08835 [Boseongicola sp.]|nr:hypothetical protein [Boseongicola sp.]
MSGSALTASNNIALLTGKKLKTVVASLSGSKTVDMNRQSVKNPRVIEIFFGTSRGKHLTLQQLEALSGNRVD